MTKKTDALFDLVAAIEAGPPGCRVAWDQFPRAVAVCIAELSAADADNPIHPLIALFEGAGEFQSDPPPTDRLVDLVAGAFFETPGLLQELVDYVSTVRDVGLSALVAIEERKRAQVDALQEAFDARQDDLAYGDAPGADRPPEDLA